jgi:divalent metal cation (Fe/Co/Zn/Cd) transporter
MANRLAIDLDIEVDGGLTVSEGHHIAVAVERAIKSRINDVYDVMVHVEPKGSFEKDERFGLSESTIDPPSESSENRKALET